MIGEETNPRPRYPGWVNRFGRYAHYFFNNAPWTLFSTFAAGLSVYAIMIMLSRFGGLEAVGQFRLMLSIIAILGYTSLIDTGKILVKYYVQEKRGFVRALLVNRLRWSVLGVLGGFVIAGVLYYKDNALALPVAVASLFMPLVYPFNMYAQIYQARREFRFNSILTLVRSAALAAFAALWLVMDWNLPLFFVMYFVVFGAFNVVFMLAHPEVFEEPSPESRQYVKEATLLSGSGLLHGVLDHADKFLIGYFLGLEALGLYAIGVTTGRLLLNVIKPVLNIYLADFVGHRLSLGFQIVSFFVLTAIGLACAGALYHIQGYVFSAEEMRSVPIAMVVLAGLGIYFVGVSRYYSSIYHRDSVLKVPVFTNMITTPLVIAYLIVSLKFGGDYALLLCAAWYSLRELSNTIVIGILTRLLSPSPSEAMPKQSSDVAID